MTREEVEAAFYALEDLDTIKSCLVGREIVGLIFRPPGYEDTDQDRTFVTEDPKAFKKVVKVFRKAQRKKLRRLEVEI